MPEREEGNTIGFVIAWPLSTGESVQATNSDDYAVSEEVRERSASQPLGDRSFADFIYIQIYKCIRTFLYTAMERRSGSRAGDAPAGFQRREQRLIMARLAGMLVDSVDQKSADREEDRRCGSRQSIDTLTENLTRYRSHVVRSTDFCISAHSVLQANPVVY